MKLVGLSGSMVGSKTRTAMDHALTILHEKHPEIEVELIDLADYDVQFSDGRNFLEYDGDTGYVAQTIMEADIVLVGTPIFQASIPAPLKNIFDLLPEEAFVDKVVGMIVTAGSPKHYLVVEQQLKPILAYMKATMVQSYVFVEEKDYYRKAITNDDVLFRMERLIEDLVSLYNAYDSVRKSKEAEYGF